MEHRCARRAHLSRCFVTIGGNVSANRVTMGRRTTIYDLANLAGASPTAVSAVLNGSWKKRRISATLAEKITRLAEEHSYAVNIQASNLRRERSKLIGMILPKYDNRYFGSIAEKFEAMARERGLFPIITCTRRNPELEIQAAREMISHQVGCLVSTGATDPDRITELCADAGVRSLNLDLPGTLAPSVVSDNRSGAYDLTRRIFVAAGNRGAPLLFVGGRTNDHNTAERIEGFRQAHRDMGVRIDERLILTGGYAPERAAEGLTLLAARHHDLPPALFVNSTIALEGVVQWLKTSRYFGASSPHIGCFDWDPLAAVLTDNILMQRQDVQSMLVALFDLIDNPPQTVTRIEVPTIAVETPI